MNPEKIKTQPELSELLTTAFYHTAVGNIRTKKSELEHSFAALVRQVEEAGMSSDLHWPLQVLASNIFPLTPKAPRDDLMWLAKMATGRDIHENREYLKFIHVSEKWVEATDGFMMGRIPNCYDLEPGFYVPYLMTKLSEVPSHWRWPDTDRVLETRYERATEEPLTADSFTSEGDKIKAWVIDHNGNKVAYNAHYAKLAFNHPSKQPPSETHIFERGNLRLEWPHGAVAMIMPMRF